MTITDLFGNDNADWMAHPGRPCNPPINSPEHIRTHADQWFPPAHIGSDRARQLCAGCPTKNPCLAYGLANPDIEGVLGGTTENERKAMRAGEAVA